MRVVLYARTSQVPFEALAGGCHAIGLPVVWQRPGVWTPDAIVPHASAVVIHGLHGNNSRIRDAYRKIGVPVWILDQPRLRDEAGAVGLYRDALAWLPAIEDVYPRPVVAADWLRDRKPEVVLVAGQKPDDCAHGMGLKALGTWARNAVAAVRESTALPVVYRPHPKSEAPVPADAFGADEVSDPATPLRAELARAAALVTYNSTAGWDAIAAGVPVISTAPTEVVAYRDYLYASVSDALSGGRLIGPSRDEALQRAAGTQWTLDEIRGGLAADVCFRGLRAAVPAQVAPRVPAVSPKARRRKGATV